SFKQLASAHCLIVFFHHATSRCWPLRLAARSRAFHSFLRLAYTCSTSASVQRALDLNPNFAAAHGFLGLALALDGQSDKAIAHAEQAIRMSPHDPQNALFNVALAGAHFVAGRYNDAIIYGRKAMQQRFGLTNGHRIYIASLAQAGQIDAARAALAKLQELQPGYSIAW